MATAAEKRLAWIDKMSNLMRASKWTEIREEMANGEIYRFGRSKGWQGACNWFTAHDEITPWDAEGDKWISTQALIWFMREA